MKKKKKNQTPLLLLNYLEEENFRTVILWGIIPLLLLNYLEEENFRTVILWGNIWNNKWTQISRARLHVANSNNHPKIKFHNRLRLTYSLIWSLTHSTELFFHGICTTARQAKLWTIYCYAQLLQRIPSWITKETN